MTEQLGSVATTRPPNRRIPLRLLVTMLLIAFPAVAMPTTAHADVTGATITVTGPSPVPFGEMFTAEVDVQISPEGAETQRPGATVLIVPGGGSPILPEGPSFLPQTSGFTAAGAGWTCRTSGPPSGQAAECTYPPGNRKEAPITVSGRVDGDAFAPCDDNALTLCLVLAVYELDGPFQTFVTEARIPVAGLTANLRDAVGPLPAVQGTDVVGFRVAVVDPARTSVDGVQVVLVAPRSFDLADGVVEGDGWSCRLFNSPYDAGAFGGQADLDGAVCERPSLPPDGATIGVAWRVVAEEGSEEASWYAGLTVDGVSGLLGSVTLRRETGTADTTPPRLLIPGPITVEEDGATGSARVDYVVTAIDDIDGPLTPQCAPPPGARFPIGTTTVACTAADAAGNTTRGTLPVTVTESAAALALELADLSTDLDGAAAAGTELADVLEGAVASVEKAAAELRKSPPDRQAAAGALEGAAGDLEAARAKGLPAGSDLPDRIAAAARVLAQQAVNLAVWSDADPQKTAQARFALRQGDALRAAGRFKDAVAKYKDALATAEGALG